MQLELDVNGRSVAVDVDPTTPLLWVLRESLELTARGTSAARPAFRYFDKGNLATIGRARAVAEIGRLRASGLFAWLLWSAVHIFFLIDFKNRIVVLLSWAWNWFVAGRGARLILGDARLELAELPPSELVTLDRDTPGR